MSSSTALYTFVLYLPNRPYSVTLYGSWDNFRNPYPLKKDTQKGSGHWTGCHAFNDIVCDGEEHTHPANRRNIGLRQGGTYYYYFVINNASDFYDLNTPYTSLCPLLPGRPVNILEVPIERPMSNSSSLVCDVERKTSEGTNRSEVPVTQTRQKMMSPLLRRKRTGSTGTTIVRERKEKMRTEWVTKGIEKLQSAASRMKSRDSEVQDVEVAGNSKRFFQTKEGKMLRKAISAPEVLPDGALRSTAALIEQISVEVEQGRSLRESFGTMSLTSESILSAEAEQLTTPQLYHSATSSVETTPSTVLDTPQMMHTGTQRKLSNTTIHSDWPLESPNMLPNYTQAGYQPQPRKTVAQDQPWVASPAAYSRHTLGAPLEQPVPLGQMALSAYSTSNMAHEYHNVTSTLHPFFRQGNRHSLNRLSSSHRAAALSRANTDDDDHNDNLSLGLGLTRQKMDVLPMNGMGLGLGVDLEAVNARLLSREDENKSPYKSREFAYLGSIIY